MMMKMARTTGDGGGLLMAFVLSIIISLLVPGAFSEVYILNHLGPASKVMMITDRQSTFGQIIPEIGLHGRLVEASPLNGCHKMEPAPIFSSNSSMIAMIARYYSFKDPICDLLVVN